jgi:hypothetical protein
MAAPAWRLGSAAVGRPGVGDRLSVSVAEDDVPAARRTAGVDQLPDAARVLAEQAHDLRGHFGFCGHRETSIVRLVL